MDGNRILGAILIGAIFTILHIIGSWFKKGK